MAENLWGKSPTVKQPKKQEDQGFLAGALGKVAALGQNFGPIGLLRKAAGQGETLSEEDAVKQARGVTDMLAPGTLLPAVGGAAIQQAKAIPTLATLGAGELMGKSPEEILNLMDVSPASFALDSGNIRQQLAQADEGGAAGSFMSGLGMVSPVARNLAEGVAATGIRGGGVLASGATQTGLLGPKRNPNDILEANAPGVESYGQAAEHGGAGAMLLGDLLNVAPALKGATGGGALNPLAETAAAQKLANLGTALEQAPLAPVSIPGKGFIEASQRAAGGAVAFPKLAESAIPGTGALSKVAEGAANFAGTRTTGFMARANQITEEARVNSLNRPIRDELVANMKQAAQAGDEVKAQGFLDKINELDNLGKKEATEAAVKKTASQGEALASKHGGETVATDIYGRVIDEAANPKLVPGIKERIYGLPSTNREALMDAATGAPASEAARIHELFQKTSTNDERIAQLQNQPTLFQGQAVESVPDALPEMTLPSIKERVQVKNIPEGFTEKSIHGHLKGLDTPSLPADPSAAKALKAWDKGMTAWKTSVLPVRPAWQATNLVGNAMAAMLMGEVDLGWFAKNAKSLAEDMKTGNIDSRFAPSMGRGIGAEAINDIGETLSTKKSLIRKPLETGKKLANKSYAAAEAVDDFSHYTVAKNRYAKNLASGMDEAAAVEEANAFALKTMGDFGNMSSAERAGVRRVMPFYPWYKHTAKASLRFPIENPGRFLQSQAWAQRLNPGGAQSPEGGEFLKNAIPLGGGKFFRLGGDIGLGIEGNPVLDPTAMGGGLAPPIQAIGASMGLNLGRGRELNTNVNQGKLSQIAGYLTNTSPTSKLAAEGIDYLRGEGDLRRDDTRGLVISKKRPVLDTAEGIPGIPAPLLPFISGSSITSADTKEIAKAAKKKTKTETKAAKMYNKAVLKKPKK